MALNPSLILYSQLNYVLGDPLEYHVTKRCEATADRDTLAHRFRSRLVHGALPPFSDTPCTLVKWVTQSSSRLYETATVSHIGRL